MLDAVQKETGNSRHLRTIAGALSVYPTYESMLAAMIKGEFPIDITGVDPDGWAQIGTALNKANLLTDATAALADLGPEATPNEMFAALVNLVNTANSNASSALSAANAAQSSVSALTTKFNNRVTKSTVDLTAGSSKLATDTIYLVYE